jgi:UDP-N-acetylmuramate--alanine ligase
LKLAPIISVITNIDEEHMDHYGSVDVLEQSFVDFANKTPFYGATILCVDDPTIRGLMPRMTGQLRTYGTEELSPDADLRIRNIECGHLVSRFDLRYRGEDLGRFEVQGVGRHNVLNAAAAAMVALELDATANQIRDGLREFIGVDRRFQLRGVRGDVSVIDDYGHHPTEICATLAAAKTCEFGRTLVIFQPHRYTRTQHLLNEFGGSFSDCDRLWVTDIYAASEDPIPGVDSPTLVEKIRAAGTAQASYVGSIEQAVAEAAAEAEPGDVIITLGAGSIWRAGDSLLQALELRFASSIPGVEATS